jgi:hypothetical protein
LKRGIIKTIKRQRKNEEGSTREITQNKKRQRETETETKKQRKTERVRQKE